MFKRILAFLLAGCLVLETAPLTADATELQAETVSDNEVEETISGGEVTFETETQTEEITVSGEETMVQEASEEETEAVVEETIQEEEKVEVVNVGDSNAESGVTPLIFGESNTITLGAYDSVNDIFSEHWYSFTATEDGYYTFYAPEPPISEYTEVFLYNEIAEYGYIAMDHVFNVSALYLEKGYMKAGETVYINAYTYSTEGVTLDLTVQKVTEYELKSQEDGSYAAELDAYTLKINMEAGCSFMRGDVSINLKEGQTLNSTYKVKVYYKKNSDKQKKSVSTEYLNENNLFREFVCNTTEATEYDVYFVLNNFYTGVAEAVFDGNILMRTGTIEAPFVIYDTSVAEGSVIFDIESFDEYHCFYAPVDGSEEGKMVSVDINWYKLTIADLQPGKEYYFDFMDRTYKTIDTRRVIVTDTTTVSYDALWTKNGLKLTANVSNYQGDATSAVLYYEYMNVLGNKCTSEFKHYLEDLETNEETGKAFEIATGAMNLSLLANTTCDITMWLQIGNVVYEKVTKQVTPLSTEDVSAGDIIFTVTAGEEEGTVDYTFGINNFDSGITALIYYKQQGDASNKYRSQTCYFSATSGETTTSGNISDLQQGATYDFIVVVGNVKKEVSATIGTSELTLSMVGDAQFNVYDFERTFKIESEEELSGTYYLRMQYLPEDGEFYVSLGDAVELNAENNYQATFNTGKTNRFVPNTEYKVKWTLRSDDSVADTYESSLVTLYETIKTDKIDILIEEGLTYFNEKSYRLFLNSDSIANLDNFTYYMYGYIRKKGMTSYRKVCETSLLSSEEYVATLTFYGLEEQTTYEVSIRDAFGTEYKKTTFTTGEDTRNIEVTPVDVKLDTTKINASITGIDKRDSCVICYVREKGVQDAWEKVTSNSGNTDISSWVIDISDYKGMELKESTTYEYKIGFGNSNDWDKTVCAALQKTVSGEFTTPEDTRNIVLDSLQTKMQRVSASYSLSGIDVVNEGYVHFYIKEKGTEDAWVCAASNAYTPNYSYITRFDISSYGDEDLKAGTTYEYQIGLGRRYAEVSALKKVISGEFTTAADERALSTVHVYDGYTTTEITVYFSGNENYKDSYISFFYREKGSDNWIEIDNSDYTSDVAANLRRKITDLQIDTEYEYVIVLCGEEYTGTEAIANAKHKVMGDFATLQANYDIDFAVKSGETTCDKAVITVKAEGEDDYSRVKAVLTLNDGQEQTVYLSPSNDYMADVTFENLTKDTEYTITSVVLSVNENDSYVKIDEIYCNYKFATPNAEGVAALICGTTNGITLDAYDSANDRISEHWYSFTAPEDGYYTFTAGETLHDISVYLYENVSDENDIGYDAVNDSSELYLQTKRLQAGDKIYLKLFTYAVEEVTLGIDIQRLADYKLIKQENGSYIAETDEYTLTANIESSYGFARGDVHLNAKEGQALEKRYQIKASFEKVSDGSVKNTYNTLSSTEDYYTLFSRQLESSNKYNVYFVLYDYETHTAIAIFEGDILVTTGATEQPFVIHDTIIEESRITFDIERFGGGYCYYAPVNGDIKERCVSVPIGWYELAISGLQPETEYYFEFTDLNKKTIGMVKETTAKSTAVITYDVVVSEDCSKLTVTADVSNYHGGEGWGYLNYEYTDALGRRSVHTQSININEIEETEGTGKNFTCTQTLEAGLLADTTYDITIWFEISGAQYGKVVKQIKTPVAKFSEEDVTFTIEADKGAASATYTLDIANYEGEINAELWYKLKENPGHYDCNLNIESDSAYAIGGTGTLQVGQTYDFLLLVCGIKKEVSVTIGEPTIWLTKVGEDEINAFDFVRTFKVESTEELTDTYYLRMYYLEEDELYYNAFGDAVVLNADNQYQITYKTASGLLSILRPDTDYKIKWTLNTISDAYVPPIYTSYETIHTAKADITFEPTDSYYDQQTYAITLNPDSVSNFISSQYYCVFGYIRKQGMTWYRQAADVTVSGLNDYCATISFSNLEEQTTYEVSMRDGYGTEYTTLTFTTPADTRKVEIPSVDAKINSAELRYSLSGIGKKTGYVLCYIREKGTENAWECIGYKSYSENSTSGTFNIDSYHNEKLKKETAYEYKVGLSDSYSSMMAALEKVTAGEFSTVADARTVTVTSVEAYKHYAYLYYSLSDIDILPEGYIYCYLREKGTEDAWVKVDSNYYSATSSNYFHIVSYNGAPLKKETTYEYRIGFGDGGNTEVVELEKVISGEFSTAADTRTLSDASVSVGYTIAELDVYFNGNEDYADSYISFFYREKGTENWIDSGYDYTNYYSGSFSRQISSLKSGIKYEYAIVVADNVCTNPDEISNGSRKATGEFETKQGAYTIDFVTDEGKISSEKASITVVAQNSTEDASIKATLTLSDGQEQTVTLSRNSGYTRDVTFKNLCGETQYTITKVVISVIENYNTVIIGEIVCDYKFTTKKAEIPTTITLSDTAITLNAVYAGSYFDGFSSKNLNAEVQPKSAGAYLNWSSSDETVATVVNGTVYAQGVGEAIITAISAYDANIKATCIVKVKNYAVGYVDADGKNQVLDSPETYYLFKGECLENYALYEIASDGTKTLLDGFTVIPAKENIVSWENGTLQAIGVGYTRVDFEKDGVKAAIYVNVKVAGKGFGITGFTSTDNNYPAVKNEDGSYTLVHLNNVTYNTIGEISPEQTFDAEDFTWSISDTTVATVSKDGVITPLKPGTVTLTVTPQKTSYLQKEVKVKLNIKGLPTTGSDTTLYAVTNITEKIGDIKFPESWGEGWTWKYPDTPLVTTNMDFDDYYYFEAVYNGTSGYPLETTVKVYMAEITQVSAFEDPDDHNGVLEVGGNDSMILLPFVGYRGEFAVGAYTIEIPEVEGLTLTRNGEGNYIVTAQKAGKYTLHPTAKVGETIVAKGSYQLLAVEEKQVGAISFNTDTEGVTIDGNKVIFDTVENKKNFNLKAIVTDRDGNEIATKLQWKTTDKSVATVTTVKNDTHNATITLKGEGHALITVTAKDKAEYSVEFDVEVQNHAPRVDTNKATVNIAYDYNDYNGKSLASSAGLVEIVPVYGESISKVQLLDESGKKVEKNLVLENYSGHKYLVCPTKDVINTKNYSCTLRVTTSQGKDYDYALKVSVVDKKPTVSAKMSSAVNLFFTDATGRITLKVSNNARLDSVTWDDSLKDKNNGFSMYGNYGNYITVSQENEINVVNGSLQDASVAKGTLSVKLIGYREPYSFNDFAVKYNYKKPSIVTKNSSSNIVPSAGQRTSSFWLYDKTNKREIDYSDTELSSRYYSEITCDSEEVIVSPAFYGTMINCTYSGSDKSKKITLTLESEAWRESLKATHTIKVVKPKAYLSTNQLTYNTSVKSTNIVYVYFQNALSITNYADIVIKGADTKAQKLLDDDLFVITTDGNSIEVKQNNAELMDATIAAGNYSYKVTPYYMDAETGEKVAMNTMTLKIKVVNKPVIAKISPKGSLDLANGTSYSTWNKKNVVLVNPKFSNISDGYSISDCKLVGEYSDYFNLYSGYNYYGNQYGYNYYVTIKNISKLKAGQTYKLAVEYTFRTTEGEEFTVTSNTFNIKPKQSKPKVTVENNNQTLYAAADDVSRTYYLYVPSYYSIESAYGSLDCNKDGKADITVSGYGGSAVSVRIVDRDAIVATAKGKTYTIPVTVQVRGCDGISKDATVKIKVKVKR